jgi:phosphatidylinositol glycan class B
VDSAGRDITRPAVGTKLGVKRWGRMGDAPLFLSTPPRWLARALLGAFVLAGAWLRLRLALTDHGIYWPDEIYQSFEPAHRWVYGYGMVPWEFIEGARTWALPGLVGLLLKLFRLLGLDSPRQYIPGVKAAFALLGAGTAAATYSLARAYRAAPVHAAAGAGAFALMAPAIYFGPRAMSETACALPATLGLALLLTPHARRWMLLTGASLLGVAVMLRLQIGLYCAGAVLILAARRQWRALGWGVLGLGVWALLFGLLDRLTWNAVPGALWGGWFHSAVVYLRFNLVEGKAAGWGTAPFAFYARHLWTSAPWLTASLGVLALLAGWRARGLFAIAAAFFVLHGLIPHKELRFLLPVLPLFCALAAVGLSTLAQGREPSRVALRWAVTAVLVAVSMHSAWGHRALTMGDLGAYLDRPGASAYGDFAPVNRLLLVAGEQPSLCGLRIDAAHLAWTGGSTYLHRDVPLYHLGRPSFGERRFNFLLTPEQPPGTEVVARDSGLMLVRLPLERCERDPSYSWRLP